MQIVLKANPFKCDVTLTLNREHFCGGWEDLLNEIKKRARLIDEGEQEVDTAYLGIAKVVARQMVMTLMSLDAILAEVAYGGFSNF